MKLLTIAAMALVTLQFAPPASAHRGGNNDCSARMLTGRWLFATGVGQQQLADAPPPGRITALGTMNIHRNGTLEGKFDVTFEAHAASPGGFGTGMPYSGEVLLNDDCTGTISFVTALGTSRTDSIAVVDRDEVWAMSQDPNNLWTYRMRRISRH